jgi:sterol 3beta-glucosyltransferase
MTRKSRTVQSEPDIFRPVSGTTTSDTPNDISHDDLSLRAAPHATDPGLSRMFTDAALYDRVLAAGPETVKGCLLSASGEDEPLPMCIGSFNELIGRDLGDNERMVTGRLAKLSVNNWDSSADDPFGVDALSEEEQGELGSPDGGEDEKPSSLSSLPTTLQEEPLEEPKLTPEEVVDLLEQEFGALALPGEEKLLLETDAAFFKDVVILVGPSHVLLTRMMAYILLSYSRVSFTSPRIDSLFTLRYYRRSRVTAKRSSRLARH